MSAAEVARLEALPVKRGPGRPRKYPITITAPAVVVTGPVKRGPGRPRKVLCDILRAAPAPVVAKRGPGRPRKVVAAKPASPVAKRNRTALYEAPVRFTAEQVAQITSKAIEEFAKQHGITRVKGAGPVAVDDRVTLAQIQNVEQRQAERAARPKSPPAQMAVPVAVVAEAPRRGRGRPRKAVALVPPTPIDDRSDAQRRRMVTFGSPITPGGNAPPPVRH